MYVYVSCTLTCTLRSSVYVIYACCWSKRTHAFSSETSTGPDVTSLAFECLSEDVSSVLPLVVDLLTRPAMPQSRIDLARVPLLDAIEHQNDAPGAIPRRELAKLIYGQSSVHARTPSAEQVAKVTKQELVQFLQTWQRPDASILGITGMTAVSAIQHA